MSNVATQAEETTGTDPSGDTSVKQSRAPNAESQTGNKPDPSAVMQSPTQKARKPDKKCKTLTPVAIRNPDNKCFAIATMPMLHQIANDASGPDHYITDIMDQEPVRIANVIDAMGCGSLFTGSSQECAIDFMDVCLEKTEMADHVHKHTVKLPRDGLSATLNLDASRDAWDETIKPIPQNVKFYLVQIPRNLENATKNKAVINIPLVHQQDGRRFDLISIVEHQGDTHHNGHYVSTAHYGTGTFKLNDDKITTGNFPKRSSSAVMLLYKADGK